MTAEQIILVRHGETVRNIEGIVQGWNDSILTEKGERQVARLAARVAALGVDAVFSSPLGRAMATAAPIASATGLGVTTHDGLREMNYGLWEGRSFLEIRDTEQDFFHRWMDDMACACPEGESHEDVRSRIGAALEEIASKAKRPVVIAHGTANRIAATALLDLPLSTARQLVQDNAAVNIFLRRGSRYVLKAWNDVAHCGE